MLKKSITFEDYNGKSITEDFYFNLSKAELLEMELSEKGGLEQMIQQIIDTEDNKRIVEVFKDLILKAHGIRSGDGRPFIKTQAIRDEFEQTGAYSELFIELATNEKSASDFVSGIVPDMSDLDKPDAGRVMDTVTDKPAE